MFTQPILEERVLTQNKRWWLELLADLLFGFAVSATFLGIVSLVSGEEPRVEFDTGYLIGCREVTTSEFVALCPGQKLMEARFQVSSLIVAGQEESIAQHVYRLDSVQGLAQVHDFMPRTTLETRYASGITKKNLDDESSGVNINLLGKYETLSGSEVTADWHKNQNAHSEYTLLPPLEAVAASGTLNRGRSVFFKLRGNERTWLEGAKEFAVILAVPAGWQGDYFRIRCEAEGVRKANGRDEKFSCGQREFLVGLYREGDEAARRAALQLVAAESQLRRQASLVRSQQQRQLKENPFTALAQSFSGKERKTGDEWLPRVTWSADDATAVAHVPKEIRPMAERYRSARHEVARLAGNKAL